MKGDADRGLYTGLCERQLRTEPRPDSRGGRLVSFVDDADDRVASRFTANA